MAYTDVDDSESFFQVKLYTGNGSDDHAITLDGTTDMQPDLVWTKNREAETSDDPHLWFDSVRGATKYISSNSSAAEATDADTLDAFQSDGFKIDDDTKINTNSETYVAWCWKESATSGFDIVTYSGTGSGTTNAHSLSAKPGWMLAKNKGATGGWMAWHKGLPDSGDKVLYFHLNSAIQDEQMFNDTEPTSSVFSVSADSNLSSNTYVAYLWAEKKGFSKFLNYVGNSSVDGKFLYCGFKPAFVMTKRTDTTSAWYVWDNKREGFNPTNNPLFAYHPSVENTGTVRIDFLSNGFKFRHADSDHNGSSGKYIFMAFAEAPLVNSNGVPCNAR